MPRPALLACDADALFQFFLSDLRPLRALQATYGIQPVIVPEVEIELKSNKKFAARVSTDVRKALSTGLIRVLDQSTLSLAGIAGPTASATLAAIQTLGAQYLAHVDFGEAYTHAAALTLGVPSLSHDISALRVLIGNGLRVPDPVLRLFDLVALAYQIKALSAADCDGIRQALNREKEWLPQCFKNSSFVSGMSAFCPRVRDGAASSVGLTTPLIQSQFSTCLVL